MAISERIQAIEEHLENNYSVLTLAGADLTNVNKNIINLKQTWQERLLYFINNGTDVVWYNWNKVTGSGTSLTLNNTLEAKMKLVLKGNTSQNGTPTPSNPIAVNTVSGDNAIRVCGKNLISTIDIFNGYPSGSVGNTITYGTSQNSITYKKCAYVEANQEYTLSWNYATPKAEGPRDIKIVDNNNIILQSISYSNANNNKSKTFTSTYSGWVYAGLDANAMNVQIEKGSVTTYEPYTGTTYPINLPVENLFDKDNANIINGYLNDNNKISSSSNGRTIYISCQPNTTYTVSKIQSARFVVAYTDTLPAAGSTTGGLTKSNDATSISIKTGEYATYLCVFYYSYSADTLTEQQVLDSIQIEKGPKTNTYQSYGTTPIELCKIGDYQDYIKRSTGKNLFNNTKLGTWTKRNSILDITYDGLNKMTLSVNSTGSFSYVYTAIAEYPATIGKTYTISYTPIKTNTITGDNTFIKLCSEEVEPSSTLQGSTTITATQNKMWLYVTLSKASGTAPSVILNNIQIEENSPASSYEPYGPKGTWYIEKNIGKVVFNGTESNWGSVSTTSSGYQRINIPISNITHSTNSRAGDIFCNNFTVSTTDNYSIVFHYNNTLYFYFIDGMTTKSQFLSFLSTYNSTVYYTMSTPICTYITDSALLVQLNALNNARSVNLQTNINQENNDEASILDATALSSLTSSSDLENSRSLPSVQIMQPLNLSENIESQEDSNEENFEEEPELEESNIEEQNETQEATQEEATEEPSNNDMR